MPFSDVEGRPGTEVPSQMVSAVPKLNDGVMIGFTETSKPAVSAHCPASGVNIYVPEF